MSEEQYEQPAAIIDPPRTIKALSDAGLIEYKAWGWVKMSAKFIGHIQRLKGSKLSTWQVISLSIDADGKCGLSVPQIARLSGYSTVETRRAIQELDDMGYLSVDRTSGKKSIYAPEFTARSGKNPTEKPSKDTPIEKETPIFSTVERAADPYLSSIENPVPTYKELKRVNAKAKQNSNIPTEVKAFREVTARYPHRANYGDVAKIIQSVAARLGRECTAEDLQPFFSAWTARGFNPTNINWLSWAVTGNIPQQGKQVAQPSKREHAL